MDSKKIIIRETDNRGRGVFAKKLIKKDELIAEWDGKIYDDSHEDWDDDLFNHAIQFAPLKWRDSKGIARILNHSCEANCGIKNLFQIVAMRDIVPGEELTWDYEMTENNKFGWQMECQCGTPSCRKLIGRYDNMPQATRDRYKGYISEWLLK
jgi:SET domain-containing protein